MMLRKQKIMGLLAALTMTALILDAQTALRSTADAITLCLLVLIPSLFPFFICTYILTSVASWSVQLPRPICSILKIPPGAGGILVIGLLGGYPAGAQAVAISCDCGKLDKYVGRRMLAFCSNAGPAFFFGIGMQIFNDVRLCLLVWSVHVISAVLVAMITPGSSENVSASNKPAPITLTHALQKALKTMATVCGWVILMKIFMGFLEHWFLWVLPGYVRSVIYGFMELSSGCCSLIGSTSIGGAIILFSAYTAFGGICVWLQTQSMVADIVDTRLYIPGKITQTALSIIITLVMQFFLKEGVRCTVQPWIILISVLWCILYVFFIAKRKLAVEIPGNIVYNQAKATGGI